MKRKGKVTIRGFQITVNNILAMDMYQPIGNAIHDLIPLIFTQLNIASDMVSKRPRAGIHFDRNTLVIVP